MNYLTLLLFPMFCFAITVDTQAQDLKEDLPGVFLLGEHEERYPELSKEYSQLLLEACDQDMKKAYQLWLQMQIDMEEYAKKIDFNLKGVKIWMHAYWGKDGKLEFISFFPKSGSINIPLQELRAFLLSFQRQYSSPVQSTQGFNHYASAHFPTSLQMEKETKTKEKDGEGF